MMRLIGLVEVLALAASAVLQGVRWWRVLQREHYLPGSTTLFWRRWLLPAATSVRGGRVLGALRDWLGALGMTVALGTLAFGFCHLSVAVTIAAAVFTPWGLSLRGRTSSLAMTRRMKVVIGVSVAVMVLLGTSLTLWLGAIPASVIVVFSVAMCVDVAAWLTRPYENKLAQKFVDQAAERLANVAPTVVAITGSYGKTSTKHHLAELLGASGGVVPTPRSFNNRAGLSRAINENLLAGTRIFIAEMGTYGPGEIADLCEWCPPSLSIVTAIGPVHLERMKSLDVIERAKFEITERASTVVLNIDDERLAGWVDRLRASGKKVITAGSVNAADVRVISRAERWIIEREGQELAEVLPVAGVRETNLACAIAAAFELGLEIYDIATRISHLTPTQHRLTVMKVPSGLTLIDDTFNANPASADVALSTLRDVPVSGRRVVVTPGLVEMGSQKHDANERLAQRAVELGFELVVVARTNARDLSRGARGKVMRVDVREQAVEWVRAGLDGDDAVLYLNDLPDHYP